MAANVRPMLCANCLLRRIRSLLCDTHWNSVYTVYSDGRRFRSLTWPRWHINKKSAKKFNTLQPNCTFFCVRIYPDAVSTRYYCSFIVWPEDAFLCFVIHVKGSLPIVNKAFILLDNWTCCSAYDCKIFAVLVILLYLYWVSTLYIVKHALEAPLLNARK